MLKTTISNKLMAHPKVPERQEQTKSKRGRWQEKPGQKAVGQKTTTMT